MEGIITLIVIIIIFNLLNRLVDAAKRKQQPPARRSRTYRFEQPMPGRTTEKKAEERAFFRPEGTRVYDTGVEDEEETGEEIDKAEMVDDDKGLETKRSVWEKAPAAPASSSLRKILSDKDSLVAAFIFHEAISGPPVSRRKKKTAFNRSR